MTRTTRIVDVTTSRWGRRAAAPSPDSVDAESPPPRGPPSPLPPCSRTPDDGAQSRAKWRRTALHGKQHSRGSRGSSSSDVGTAELTAEDNFWRAVCRRRVAVPAACLCGVYSVFLVSTASVFFSWAASSSSSGWSSYLVIGGHGQSRKRPMFKTFFPNCSVNTG